MERQLFVFSGMILLDEKATAISACWLAVLGDSSMDGRRRPNSWNWDGGTGFREGPRRDHKGLRAETVGARQRAAAEADRGKKWKSGREGGQARKEGV